MAELVDYALKAGAVILVLFWLLFVAPLLLLSAPGIVALFVAVFVVLRAAASGATLLALGFLYPSTVDVAGLRELLWLVALASLASVLLFDFGLEGFLLKALQRRGMSLTGIRGVEAVGEGLITAIMLVLAARVLTGFGSELFGTSEVGLSLGAALGAGSTSAFVRYFLGVLLVDVNAGYESR